MGSPHISNYLKKHSLPSQCLILKINSLHMGQGGPCTQRSLYAGLGLCFQMFLFRTYPSEIYHSDLYPQLLRLSSVSPEEESLAITWPVTSPVTTFNLLSGQEMPLLMYSWFTHLGLLCLLSQPSFYLFQQWGILFLQRAIWIFVTASD